MNNATTTKPALIDLPSRLSDGADHLTQEDLNSIGNLMILAADKIEFQAAEIARLKAIIASHA